MVSSDERVQQRRLRDRARRKRFELLISSALRSLPPDVQAMLDNVDVVVAAEPNPDHLRGWVGDDSDGELLGLYEGTPLIDRTGGGMRLPDKITIFQGPIERSCATREEMAEEVRITVLHELAHHFGLDEDRIDELGLG